MDNNNRNNNINYGNPYSNTGVNQANTGSFNDSYSASHSNDAYSSNGNTAYGSTQSGLYGQPAPAGMNQNFAGQNNQDFYYHQNIGGQPYGQPYGQQFVPKPAAPGHGLAVGALVCGILGLILSCGVIGGIFGLVAIILAIVAGKKGNTEGVKKGGLITGIIGLIISILSSVIIMYSMSVAFDEFNEALKDSGVDGGWQTVMTVTGDTSKVMSAFRKAAKDTGVKKDPDYDDALDELRGGIVLNGYDPEDNCIVEKAYEIFGEDEMEEYLDVIDAIDGKLYVQMDSANSVEVSLK